MYMYDITEEELEQSKAIDDGEFKSVKNVAARKAELTKAARGHMSKTTNINIRISERDLYKLKAKAYEEGLPYQTMIVSLLHKAVA
jgi:predicted DNA binding CopG/RHH family protein